MAWDKTTRRLWAENFLYNYEADWSKFKQRLVTSDETWLLYEEPETKQTAAEWKAPGEQPQVIPKLRKTHRKVMGVFFWDAQGIILIDYVPPGISVTGQYYADLVRKLARALATKRPHMRRSGAILLHDNARAHISTLVDEALRAHHIELTGHPTYSPDLSPSDYHLFPNLKMFLKGKQFKSVEEIKRKVDGWAESLEQKFFEKGIDALLDRTKKCIELDGGYILD
jgi:histone-lysine N-methyltransferase SETMAR